MITRLLHSEPSHALALTFLDSFTKGTLHEFETRRKTATFEFCIFEPRMGSEKGPCDTA